MNLPTLPTCRHRGEQMLPDRWLCYSDRLVLQSGLVSGEMCRSKCSYVDHETDAATPPWADTQPVPVELDPAFVSVAVITAPRLISTLPQTLAELRRACFTQSFHIFAEPDSPVANEPGLVLHWNSRQLGIWGNWLSAARWMLTHTDTPFLLICEDDVRFCPCASLALQHAINTLSHNTWGYVSLYTARHNLLDFSSKPGWRKLTVGAATWGALAWCFTRQGLQAILNSRTVRSHSSTDGTDSIVSLAANELGRSCYFHIPSLGDHIGGDLSTQRHYHSPGHALGVEFSPLYRGYVPHGAGTRTSSTLIREAAK